MTGVWGVKSTARCCHLCAHDGTEWMTRALWSIFFRVWPLSSESRTNVLQFGTAKRIADEFESETVEMILSDFDVTGSAGLIHQTASNEIRFF